MTDRKPPELFAERPIRSDFARPGIPYAARRILTLLVLALIIGGGLYWKFGTSSQPVAPGEIPVIKSEGAYKQRPEQPGGLDIPHQDVQVYQELDNKAPPQPEVEHLLPPPETPVAPPAKITPAPPTPQQLESLTPEPKKVVTTATQPDLAPPPAAAPLAPVTSPTPPAPAVEAASAPQPVAAKPAAVATNTAPQTIDDVLKDVAAQGKAAPAAATGNSAIQLAATQDQTAAQTMKNQLQSKYAAILGSTQLRLVKADLGAKGIYYRIQSQPVSEDKAKSLCAALKNAKAGCILVHP